MLTRTVPISLLTMHASEASLMPADAERVTILEQCNESVLFNN